MKVLPKNLGNRRQFLAPLLAALLFSAGLAVDAQTSAPATTKPAPAMRPGWEEIDQRLVFLTVQLSTVESTIDATNKALKVNGYQQAAKQAAAEQAKRGNELMDRNGGGPVPWQEFYGKTAEKFFYHPTDGITVHVNPDAVAQRPPQFDYIYRANEKNRQKADEDASKIGSKIDDLLDYRRQLESDQSALWCKIAFRGISSREINLRPIYRLELTGGVAGDDGKQALEAAKAAAQFMKDICAELVKVQKDIDDQKVALEHLAQVTSASRATLQTQLVRLTSISEQVADSRSSIGQFTRSAKRLEDSSQNLLDAYKLALDCESHNDQTGKQSYRGQLQQMAFDYAASVETADQAISKAITDWKITAVTKSAVETPVVTDPGVTDPIEKLAATLDAAKVTRQKDVTAARRTFVSAIDAKLNAAADAGDLAQVQALQSAKGKAALDGTLNDDIKDESLIAARGQMVDAIKAADGRLVKTYRDTVAGYTRARKITEAQSIQDELTASGLSLTAPDANTGADTVTVKPPVVGGAASTKTSDSAFPLPELPNGRTEIDLPGPVEETVVGGGGRYLILHIKKLQQLAVFDVSQLKVLKYLPIASNDIVYAAGAKKLFVGLKDLKQIQRWDLEKLTLELTVASPEGGITAMATGSNVSGPVVLLGEKRFWLVNPNTLKAESFPSKNWGSDGSAWGPVHVHVSYDGTTVVANGGGWAGIELSNIRGEKVVNTVAGYYVNGEAFVAGNGSLVFPSGGIVRSDLSTPIKGIEGHAFAADDAAFSLSMQSDKGKPTLVLFSNSDPRPLATIRDLPELGKNSKAPPEQRVHLITRGKVLVTLADGGEKLVLRKFDIAAALEAEGLDFLFVESAPVISAERGSRYTYKLQVRSKKGDVKFDLQSGPKGMTIAKDGTLQWSVPTKPDSANVPVIVQVSDASGQTIFHTFSINTAESVNRK